jgi:hypothetical protein
MFHAGRYPDLGGESFPALKPDSVNRRSSLILQAEKSEEEIGEDRKVSPPFKPDNVALFGPRMCTWYANVSFVPVTPPKNS